jgi:hypothetical protein
MRYIVATLPTFRLQRLGYHDHCAAILLSGRGGVVLAMTAAARRIGATASEPKGARVLYLSPKAEADSLEALMLDVSPDHRTFSLPPDAFGLEVRAEDEHALCVRLAARLSARGYQARLVVADDPGAALAVSAWTKQAITVLPMGGGFASMPHLPIEVLGMSPDLVAKLAALGVRTVGAFAALPENGMERFGPAAVVAHRLARGGAVEVVEPVQENVIRLQPAHSTCAARARGIRLEFRQRAG